MDESIVRAGPSPVLDCPDPRALAAFYCDLLGWQVTEDNGEWVGIRSPTDRRMMSFQYEPHYRPPSWPTGVSDQQMMIHLDFEVHDIEEALAKVIELGARPARWQPQEDVRVCVDPAGHVFCLA